MNEELKEKLKMKIAISQIKNEEEKTMNKRERFIIKNIGIAACVLISMSGVAFAGSKVIENIWKTPEKIENATSEITEESRKENISEIQAKEIAINKLKEVGFDANIVGTNHYKDIDSNKITYRFSNEDKYEISIDGQTGEFSSIWNNSGNTQDRNVTITEDEAKEAAMKYYKLFGFKEGEYEITRVWSNNKDASGEGPGFKIDITFNKKYGEIYNPFEKISIAIESKNKDFDYISVQNIPFDNNEIIITEDEAIQIALKEDAKIETNKIIETKAKKMIVKMNSDAYERMNNKEKYYAQMQPNYPNEERNRYKVEDRIRNAWVVVITYEDTYNGDIMKRYTEGQYSYFVDCTTGEIIGGHAMDYTYSNEIKEREEVECGTCKSNDEKYSKTVDNVNIELNIPNEWKYKEIPRNEENDFYKFALKLYKNNEEQYAVLYFYNNPFAVCGTGRTSEKITLDNGKDVAVGYYDRNKNWSDISFYSINKYIAVINEGLINYEAREVIEFIKTINII